MKKYFFFFLIVLVRFSNVSAQSTIVDSAALRAKINSDIATNTTQSITAYKLNNIFNGMLNVMQRYKADSVWLQGGHLFYKKFNTTYDQGILTGLPNNGDSTYYYAGDGVLHKLSLTISGGDTTIFDIVVDSTSALGYRVPFGIGNNHLGSNNKFLYDSTRHKLVLNNSNISFGGNGIKLGVNGNVYFNGTAKIGAYTLPATDGTNGYVLKTNGAGTVTWQADNNSGTGAGNNNPDSLASHPGSYYASAASVALKLNITDTAAINAEIVQLRNGKLNIGDTSIINAEIVQLRNAQALKLNISDTAAMLSSYSTKINKNIDSITAHNTRILSEATARYNKDVASIAVTGTTTKTITVTFNDATTTTGTFTDATGGGGTTDKQSFVLTAAQTSVTITGLPASANDFDIFYNDDYLNPSYYTFSGTTLTFTFSNAVAGDTVDYARKK